MNSDEILRLAIQCQLVTTGNRDGIYMEALERFANLVLASRKPLTDDHIWKIIEQQSALTGWKVPPTKQVARAVERAHGIGDEP